MRWITARISRVVPPGSLGRNVAVLAASSALGQGLVVLATPVLTRLYSPEDFGLFAIYGSVLGVALVIVSLRYELAIPLPEDDDTGARLVVVGVGFAVATSAASLLGVWAFGDALARQMKVPALGPLLWVLPVSLVAGGVYQALTYWCIRVRTFRDVARTRVAQGGTHAVTAVGLGWAGVGPAGLLVGDLMGRLAAGVLMATLAARGLSRRLQRLDRSELQAAAKLYRRFPLISTSSGLLNRIGFQVPTLLAAALYGPKVAGWYELTQRVIGVPMSVVGGAVAQAYLSQASRLASEPQALRQLFTQTSRRLLLLGGVPVLALGLGAPWLFFLTFGEEWSTAGRYAQLLAASFVVQFVAVPLSQTLNILQRQDLQFVWDVGRLLAVVLCFALARRMGLSAMGAMASYGAVLLLSYLGLYAMSLVALRHDRTE